MNRVDRSQNLRRFIIRARYTAALAALGWTSGDLARRLGCSPTLADNWRHGRHGQTPPDCVLAWLEVLALHRGTEPQPPTNWRRPRGLKPAQSSG
ncbi:MAG TPA: hypothetical protein VHY82_16025 [Acetobacteraceae bacterium]|jgi:transcriptional regulator with XRE-family HTH domain|nr:hypothetical protein [Acetobacteraceae bacterium]